MNELEEGHDTNLPLHALAKRDGVVFVVVDRAIADGMRDFGEPIRMRIRRDKYDGRLRHFDIAPRQLAHRAAPSEAAGRKTPTGAHLSWLSVAARRRARTPNAVTMRLASC